jgi:hypothetical protein
MTQDESFKTWWYEEGSQPPYTHHDCEEHTMRMCEIAWANGAYKEREACAKKCEAVRETIWEYHEEHLKAAACNVCTHLAFAIRARGQA